MIKPITFEGKSNFSASAYANEVKSRFMDMTKANGYYKSYGTELAVSFDGLVANINTGILLIQGRAVEVIDSETVIIPNNGKVGYIIARIETFHPADDKNCKFVVYTADTLNSIKLIGKVQRLQEIIKRCWSGI